MIEAQILRFLKCERRIFNKDGALLLCQVWGAITKIKFEKSHFFSRFKKWMNKSSKNGRFFSVIPVTFVPFVLQIQLYTIH